MADTSNPDRHRFARFRPRSFALLRNFDRHRAVHDVFAGLTVGLIALPLALALGVASIPAGVATPFPPPAIGLFTAIIGGFIVSALGGSRVQIGGPTAAFVPVVLLVIERHGFNGLLIATMMAGVILVLMGFAGLGTLIKFIPYPVVSGFTTGIAVTLVIGQSADFLGLAATTPAPAEFFSRIAWLFRNLPHVNPVAAGLGLACLLLIVLWPKLKLPRVPGTTVAMIGATVIVAMLGWQHAAGVVTIGSRFGPEAIPSGFPPFAWPNLDLEHIRELVIPATSLAMLGAIESLLSAVVADGLINDRHDSNTELIAQGFANIVCPFFCGLPVTGAIARTSANVRGGARSPLAGITHAVVLLFVVLAFSRYAQFVPVAAIAAVLVFVAFRMGEWHELTRLRKMPASDALVLVTTFLLTVVFDLVTAVLVGMVLASMLFLRRVAETTEISRVTANDELETPEHLVHGKEIPEGVVVYRIFGPFLFGAAEKMEDALLRLGELPPVIILRMHLVPAMDATALNALESIHERLLAKGGTLVLSGPHRQPLEVMRNAGFFDRIGRKNVRANFDDALVRARTVLAEPHGQTPPA